MSSPGAPTDQSGTPGTEPPGNRGPQASPQLSPAERTAFRNLAALVALGVGVLTWFGYHTDLLPMIGGLLGLGGVLAWIAFIGNLLTEERANAIRRYVDLQLVANPKSWKVVLILAGLLIVVGSGFGTIEIDGLQQPVDRQVFLTTVEEFPKALAHRIPDRLAAHGRLRFPCLIFPGANRERVVKVNGYPARVVNLRRFGRETLSLPASFRRRVVLLRPSLDLYKAIFSEPPLWNLRVKIGRQEGLIDGYFGGAVWIGAQADVPVPQKIAVSWQDHEMRDHWLEPVSPVGNLPVELREGQAVEVYLDSRETTNEGELVKEFRVKSLDNPDEFVQVVDLELPAE